MSRGLVAVLRLDRFQQSPPVGAVMTPFPYFAEPGDSLESVRQLMAEHGIRHLPVQQDGAVVGVISERDVGRGLGSDSESTAADVAIPDPYVVGIGTPLVEVLREMNRRRIGSAIVVRQGKLAGILSVIDVCRLLADVIDARFGDGGGEAA